MTWQADKGFTVEKMAKILGVSRSGYYRFSKGKMSLREQENTRLLKEIESIHIQSRQLYGSPRIHAELKEKGILCSRPRVARLMMAAGIRAKMPKQFKVTTKASPTALVSPKLLNQSFKVQDPHKVWVSDITYIPTLEGWLYLAITLDLFSRMIIGMAMEARLKAELVLKALSQALGHRGKKGKTIHHSDKGSQYTSGDFAKMAKQNGITLSMSGTGNCYDNAVAESFFHTLKNELLQGRIFKTREEARQAIFEYILVFYNRKRKHSTLGYVSPAEFEQQWKFNQNVSVQTVH
jgi:transposase InsO family protein